MPIALAILAGCTTETAVNGLPEVQIVSPDGDTELRDGEAFNVVADVDDDAGASTLALEWSIQPEPESAGNGFFSDGQATLYLDEGLPEGDWTVGLIVTDAQGATSTDAIELDVDENKRPRVVIRQPEPDETYDDADPLIVTVEVDPRDDAMGSIELIWDGVAASAPDAPPSPPDDGLVIFTIEGLERGTETLTVTARDRGGGEDTDTVEFTLR